ncbi:MAG: molybdopterin-dependent oxidoreductase [Halieaceae bacterium]|nr:molybdopterin-dependent oxidoreductase [Halieaceae bacterium]
MTITTQKTYCRYCHAYCPMDVDVDEGGTVTAVRPDTSNSHYGGYTCIKGRQLVEQMYQPERLTECQKKTNGSFSAISSQQALDEVADKLRQIIDEHGPRAVATYNGTYAFQNSAQLAFSRAFHDALGSPSYYTSVTIDQPAKVFVGTRHGYWGAGGHFFEDSDVTLIIGNNPMVSQYAPPGGVPSVSPFERLRDAKKRGHTLIAVDPRSTELTRRAEMHLQIQPGEDSTLLASMIRLIIEEGLHDAEFCAAHTEGLEELRASVEPYTLDYAAERTQVPAEQIAEAARRFAAGPRGVAITGTGPEMSEHPNLTQHLVASLNSLCGRYYREGDTLPNPGMLAPPAPRRAQALQVPLAWSDDARARSRIDENLGELTTMGMMGPVREMPTNLLSDEILTPGEGQVRALIVVGGNPLMAFPNQEKTYEALKDLDLLVCIDAYLSSGTCQMADYVFAPKLTLERDDVTLLADPWYEEPYSQYAEAVVASSHDVLEEWEVFWELSHRLGIDVAINGTHFPGPERPSKFDVLSAITTGSRADLAWLRDNPGGHSFPDQKVTIEGPDETAGKLQFFPEGVAEDFAAALAPPAEDDSGYALRLISSRSKYVLNSSGRNLSLLRKKQGDTNPVLLHPDDMAALGLEEDCLVQVQSEHGTITGVARAYDRIKPGVVTMHHSWGPVPGPDADEQVREQGANTNRLIDNRTHTQRYTGMTRQSAIPVNVTRKEQAA